MRPLLLVLAAALLIPLAGQALPEQAALDEAPPFDPSDPPVPPGPPPGITLPFAPGFDPGPPFGPPGPPEETPPGYGGFPGEDGPPVGPPGASGSAVPEPATALLLVGGLLGLVWSGSTREPR